MLSSKREAKEAGEKKYFTGKSCKNGHISPRWTHNSSCMGCLSENSIRWSKKNRGRQAAWMKAWRKANPEKESKNRKKANDAYLSKSENRIKSRLAAKKRYAEKGNEIRKRAKELRPRRANKIKSYMKKWNSENRERRRALEHNREARKRGNGGSHTASDIKNIFDAQGGKCAYCKICIKKNKRHIDHIIPLILGGSNDRENIQLLCVPCNLQKGPLHPLEYARNIGLLL